MYVFILLQSESSNLIYAHKQWKQKCLVRGHYVIAFSACRWTEWIELLLVNIFHFLLRYNIFLKANVPLKRMEVTVKTFIILNQWNLQDIFYSKAMNYSDVSIFVVYFVYLNERMKVISHFHRLIKAFKTISELINYWLHCHNRCNVWMLFIKICKCYSTNYLWER